MNEQATRMQRRAMKIKAAGRKWKVLKYLQERSKDLPLIVEKKTGKPVDHVYNVRRAYMDGGFEAVDEYLDRMKAVHQRDRGKSLPVRIWGWIKCKVL